MKRHDVRETILASAEKPFRVCLADGRNYRVPHADFAFVTSESLILASGPGRELDSEFVVIPWNTSSELKS